MNILHVIQPNLYMWTLCKKDFDGSQTSEKTRIMAKLEVLEIQDLKYKSLDIL